MGPRCLSRRATLPGPPGHGHHALPARAHPGRRDGHRALPPRFARRVLLLDERPAVFLTSISKSSSFGGTPQKRPLGRQQRLKPAPRIECFSSLFIAVFARRGLT